MNSTGNNDDLQLRIVSLTDAYNILSHKTDYHVVSIRNTTDIAGYDFDAWESHYRSIVKLLFDDIDNPILINRFSCLYPPKREHVQQVLTWAEGKDNFLVHCQVGISRSSAMAYIIACARMGPEKAMQCLNLTRHRPNRLILKYGQELLGNPDIVPVFEQHLYDYYKQFR